MNTLTQGMRVRVHVNLHKGNFSVVNPKTGLVITNVSDAVLSDVQFRHQPKCVEGIVKKGQRAVCAYVIGTLESWDESPVESGTRVSYNPFRRPDFHVAETGETVAAAARVLFVNRRAFLI